MIFLTTLCAHREMDELVAMGEDGKEIITPPGEIDFDPLRKAEEEGMKEGWWMEKVGDLKYKMERLLKLELSRYTPPARCDTLLLNIYVCHTDTSTDNVTTTPFRSSRPRRRNAHWAEAAPPRRATPELS